MNTSGANLYTDFSAFSNLRAEARSGSAEGKRAAAEQIEAMFLGMMLKSMRAAGGSMLEGPGAKVREGMFDSQLALNMAKNSKMGFADLMMREFNHQRGTMQTNSGAESKTIAAPGQVATELFARGLWGRPVSVNEAALIAHPASTTPGHPNHPTSTVVSSSVSATDAKSGSNWRNAQEFATHLWPAAQRAAKALGTRPEAVLAVAALETGWGQHLPSSTQGGQSNNLFGIKAHGWAGPVTHSQTLEFESGGFVKKLEPFRSYATAQQSFEDFVQFIKTQPRYADALNSAGDPVAFVQALQEAGYATDPNYAAKVERLMNSDTMRKAQAISESKSVNTIG